MGDVEFSSFLTNSGKKYLVFFIIGMVMNILDVVVPIFSLMAIGWAIRRLGYLSNRVLDGINNYVYFIGISLITFVSLHDIDLSTLIDVDVYLLNIVPMLAALIIAYFVAKKLGLEKKLLPVFILCAFFGNTGYIGFPVNVVILGSDSLTAAAFISTIYTVFVFTIGIFVIQKTSEKGGKSNKIYKIPIIWAAVLGLALSWVAIPDMLRLPINLISESVSPLALFATGAMVASAGSRIDIKEIGLVSIIKLIILPAMVILVGMAAGDNSGILYKSSLLEAATPVAVTNTILAAQFRLNYNFASNAVVISTVLFAITLPIVMYFL